jgi:hypothetical protein
MSTVLTTKDIENLGLQVFIQEKTDQFPKRVVFPDRVDVVKGEIFMWVPRVPDMESLDKEKPLQFDSVDDLPEPPRNNLKYTLRRGRVIVTLPDGSRLETP